MTSRLFPFLFLALLLLSCTSAPARGGSGVAVAGERVLVASAKGKVFALDVGARSRGLPFPAPGEWAFPEKGSAGAIYAAPLAEGERVYVASYQGQLSALDGVTGKALGDKALFKGGSVVGAPVLEGGVLYLASGSKLFALNPLTGQPLWPKPFQAGNRIWGSPVVAGETIYLGSLDHHVYALRTKDGSVIWEYKAGGAIASSPTLGDGGLFFSAFDGLYSLEAETGSLRWHFPSRSWFWGRPLLWQGKVFAGSQEGRFYGLDARTGKQLWEPVPTGGTFNFAPALREGVLLIGSDRVYALDPEGGQLLGTWELPAPVAGDLVVAEGVAYVQAKNQTLFALGSKWGEVLWSFSLDR
ncbi:MAG: PQQ-binding-like beta-propeller repeat protein [Chloroflexi bacterium]|nr:PQQ-binding-like beta-propeller repeat protein [Chloroflexota bacterium]